MIVKNQTELKLAMQQVLKQGMEDLTKEVHSLANEFIHKWYDDYDPKIYGRTYQLFKACIATEVVQSGSKFKSYILLDSSKMHHGLPIGYTEEDVILAAEKGLHGTDHAQKGKKKRPVQRLFSPTRKHLKNTTFIMDEFKEYLENNGFYNIKIV